MLRLKTQTSQLFFTYFIIVILIMTALGWIITTSVHHFYYAEKQIGLKNQALTIERILMSADLKDSDNLIAFCETLGSSINIRITLIDDEGVVLADSDEKPWKMENHANRPEIISAKTHGFGTAIRFSPTLQHEMMYRAYATRIHGQPLVIRTSLALTSLEDNIRGIYWRIFIGALLISLAALAISYVLARKIAAPLKIMQQVAGKYAMGDFSTRLELENSTEIHGLAESLNTMARQLDERIRTVSRQKNEQRAVLASMIEALLAVDNEGKILMINRAARRMFGIRQPDPVGLRVSAVIRNNQLINFIDKVLNSHQQMGQELKIKGDFFGHVYVTGTSIEDEAGNSPGAVIVLSDITRIKESEKIRTEFVANVSHELKTPITAIKGYVETLVDLEDPADYKKFLKIINRQSDHLNSIVDDLLELSRIEEQESQSEMDFVMESVNAVFDESLLAVEDLREKEKIEIRKECPEDLKISMNSRLMREALVNLLNNALKYSPEKSTILLKAVPEGKDLILSVQDFGIGIPAKHIHRIFERFYRVDKARSKKLGGTGLGLAIVKHIAHVHRGSVEVHSKPDEGSTFNIRIPMGSRA